MITTENITHAESVLEEYYQLVDRCVRKKESEIENLSHMMLGLMTELAELDESFVDTEGLDWVNVREEVGDQIFYIIGYSIFRNFKLKIEITNRTYTASNILRSSGKLGNLIKRHLAYDEAIPVNEEQQLAQKVFNGLMNFYEQGQHIDSIKAMERVIAKLNKRYKNGFSVNDAVNRNLEEERKALEGK